MSEFLLSILCGEERWYWDPHGGCTIQFNEDGTGELLCSAELQVWIAVEFKWKLHNIESLDDTIDFSNVIDDARMDRPRLISRFNIELTLAKRCIPRFRQSERGRTFNESLLVDDAFLPKTYIIKLEKGLFKTPYDVIENEYTQRWALRLVFEPSPYPPLEEWKGAKGYAEGHKFWERKEFCGRSSKELQRYANRRRQGTCAIL